MTWAAASPARSSRIAPTSAASTRTVTPHQIERITARELIVARHLGQDTRPDVEAVGIGHQRPARSEVAVEAPGEGGDEPDGIGEPDMVEAYAAVGVGVVVAVGLAETDVVRQLVLQPHDQRLGVGHR